MILPRPIRKFIAVFRGGISPLLIILSVTLGLCFGLIPGFGGIHVLIILLFLAINIHLGLFLTSAAVGKMLCLAAAPLMFHLGNAVHTYIPGLLTFLAKIPIIGLTDFSRYSIAGAIIIGPVVGMTLGLGLSRTVIAFRKAWLKLEENSEAFKKWSSKRWVRVLDRVLIGKRAGDVRKVLEGKSPIVRKTGVVLAALLCLIAAVTASLLKDEKLNSYATTMLTQANGAEVNVDKLDLSLLTGKLAAAGIEVTDPEKPHQNQVAVGGIAADADIYNMLCGNLVMESVRLSNVQFDQPRQSPGKVLTAQTRSPEPVTDKTENKTNNNAGINKLEAYFKNAKQVKEWLRKISKYLPRPRRKTETDAEIVPQRYLEYLTAKARTAPAPRLIARRIVLDEVELAQMQFGKSRILVTNASDNPYAAALPVEIEITSLQNTQSVNMTCHFESKSDIPEITGTFNGFDLQRLQSQMSDSNKLVLRSGTASGTFSGKVTNESVDLKINVKIENLQAGTRGKRLLGIDAKSVARVFDALKTFETEMRLAGPTNQPRLSFDTNAITEQFKKALAEAGKEKLKQEIDNRLQKKLGDKVPDQIKEVLEKPADLVEGLGELFNRKKEKP